METNIPKTSSPINGRTIPIKIGETTLNCFDTITLCPAMNEPSIEMQAFQGGDAVNVTADGGYQSSTYTCEYTKSIYDAIDQARADVTEQSIIIGGTGTGAGGNEGFKGTGIVTVSEGPTLRVNGNQVPTMTVTVNWTSVKEPTGVGE